MEADARTPVVLGAADVTQFFLGRLLELFDPQLIKVAEHLTNILVRICSKQSIASVSRAARSLQRLHPTAFEEPHRSPPRGTISRRRTHAVYRTFGRF